MRSHILREAIALVCISIFTPLVVQASPSSGSSDDGVDPGSGTSTAVQGLLQNAAVNPPQAVAGELVEFICPPGNLLSSDLQNRCDEIVVGVLFGGDVSGALEALQDLAPEESSAIQTTEVDTSQAQLSVLRGRLASLRSGGVTAMNFSIDGMQLTTAQLADPDGNVQQGGGASADGSGRLGVFVNGNFGIGDKDSTARETGFDLDSYGVTGGVDYLLNERSVVGVAVGYTTSEADLDANSGSLETDGIAVSVYGSFYPTAKSYINAILSYTTNDHEQDRRIAYTINNFRAPGTSFSVDQSALSETDSEEYAISLEGGFDYTTGRWLLTPYARVDVAKTLIDGYTETLTTPAPGTVNSDFALQINDQDISSATLAFGGRLTTPVESGWGTLYPQVGAEYVRELKNDGEPVSGRLIADTSNSVFTLGADEPDRSYFNVTAGVIADFGSGWSAHAVYQGLVDYEDLSVHVFEVGARLQF